MNHILFHVGECFQERHKSNNFSSFFLLCNLYVVETEQKFDQIFHTENIFDIKIYTFYLLRVKI
jgi:predicted DNA-binding ribbon-helix-helix protein